MTQFVSPDDEHDVLETCRELKIKNKNKYIVKNCASRWSFTKNHNTWRRVGTVKSFLTLTLDEGDKIRAPAALSPGEDPAVIAVDGAGGPHCASGRLEEDADSCRYQ